MSQRPRGGRSDSQSIEDLFSPLPTGLRSDLLGAFAEIEKNYRARRWEPAELNGGKLSEAAYWVLRGYIDGKYPDRARKPKNMVDACRALEREPGSAAPRSIRIQIPRMLVALYEIRNERNVGHVGGEVDPNPMDATCVLQMAKWIVAELIRVLHQVTVEEATSVVEALAEREVPIVWEVGEIRRVLDPTMKMKDRTLILLYATPGPVPETDLRAWTDHSNLSVYRRDVLRPAHTARLLEYDDQARTAQISPRGARYVEEKLPLAI